MTLGEWLNSLILQSGELPEGLAQQLAAEVAAEASGSAFLDADEDDDGEDVSELQTKLETLNRRLEQSERQSALAVSGIDQSIERLATSIESSRRMLATGEAAPKTAVNELASRMERLQSQLEHVAMQGRSGLDPRTLQALEKAIAGVAAHIEKSDRRNVELVQSVEVAINELSAKVEHAEIATSESNSRIDLSVDRLGSRLDATEAEQRRSSARLNERLAQLDERLATSLVQRESGISGIERRLGGLENRLESVHGQIKTQIDEFRARPILAPEAFTRKEFEDWTRRLVADQGASHASSRQSLANLEARLAVLGERLERTSRDGPPQSSVVIDRVSETARQATERADAAHRAAGSVAAELKEEILGLSDRLERTNHTATETMQALEGVLRSLTPRLDAVDGRAVKPPRAEMMSAPAATIEMPDTVAPPPPATERAAPAKSPGWLWRDNAAPPADIHPQAEEIEHVFEPEPADVHDSSFASPSGGSAEGRIEEALEHQETLVPVEAGAQRGFDLTNLFNLTDAKDRQPEDDSDVHAEPAPYSPAHVAADSENAAEDDGWLERARRAATASHDSDPKVDFSPEKKEAVGLQRFLIPAILVVIGLFILFMFLAVPTIKKFFGGGAHQNISSPAPASSSHSPVAPAQKPLGQVDHNTKPIPSAPPSNDIAPKPPGATQDGLAPRGDEFGTPLAAGAKLGADQIVPLQKPLAPPLASAPSAPAPVKLGPTEALQAAADSGKPQAQYAQALVLKAQGASAPAIDLMKKAAGQGVAIAARKLGIWYEQGDGVPKNIAEAGRWYLRAAQAGDIEAMHNLGYFYAQGAGGLQKDGGQAEHWFKSAAERGLIASQVNLSIVYSKPESFGLAAGNDLQTRMNEAYFWAALAAARGDAQAETMRDSLAGNLKPEAKLAIDKQVDTWRPKPFDAIANGGFDTSAEAFLPASDQKPLTREEIITIQERLNELGYKAGGTDGKTGVQFEKAIRAFQAAYRLPDTGTADHNLLSALEAVPH